jgi:hypothetical protein
VRPAADGSQSDEIAKHEVLDLESPSSVVRLDQRACEQELGSESRQIGCEVLGRAVPIAHLAADVSFVCRLHTPQFLGRIDMVIHVDEPSVRCAQPYPVFDACALLGRHIRVVARPSGAAARMCAATPTVTVRWLALSSLGPVVTLVQPS